jgi:hypothetical protein
MKFDIIPCAALAALTFSFLLYRGRGYLAWVLAGGWRLLGWLASGPVAPIVFGLVTGLWARAAVVFGVPGLRREVVTKPLMPVLAGALPRMGDTERIALEAGTVWWDGDLFSGDPAWRRLLEFTPRGLTDREREFLEGPVGRHAAAADEGAVARAAELVDVGADEPRHLVAERPDGAAERVEDPDDELLARGRGQVREGGALDEARELVDDGHGAPAAVRRRPHPPM